MILTWYNILGECTRSWQIGSRVWLMRFGAVEMILEFGLIVYDVIYFV